MSDVFISYARSTSARAAQIAEALRALGYHVWRDDELPAHRGFADVIEERLAAAKAVVVVWSAEAVRSEWVQSEADRARVGRKLVQLSLDGAPLPMPFDRIQCADLAAWNGEADAPGWRKVVNSIAALTAGDPAATPSPPRSAPAPRRVSVCVLPFANMSGDPEQDYFSDGITEDIITDLTKVSALTVASRNTAFTFKGRKVGVAEVARQLGVTHVLEGSVRKAGARVRITAQLVAEASDSHVWAERYDRDLDDIFALQDEISEAIVAALKLQLLPAEKKAIEKRGDGSAEAYDLYLMARQYFVTGKSDMAAAERLLRRATQIDPDYARAWALLAAAQGALRHWQEQADVDPLAAIERALALDPDLAEAHSVKAAYLAANGQGAEALAESEIAVRLDPGSFQANFGAAHRHYNLGQFHQAATYFEKAVALEPTHFDGATMLFCCYAALGDAEGVRRAAAVAFERAEAAVAQDPGNGAAMGAAAFSLAALGEAERAKGWARRAMLVDPENLMMRLNLACAFSRHLGDADAALDLLAPVVPRLSAAVLGQVKSDPDFDPIRADLRFVALVAEAEQRLAGGPP